MGVCLIFYLFDYRMERIDTSPGAPENESKLIGFKGLLIATQAIALLIFFLLCHWLLNYAGGFAWRSNPDLQFNWHPFFMIFGMVILYAQCKYIVRSTFLFKEQFKIFSGKWDQEG